jgi:hypothetical protein
MVRRSINGMLCFISLKPQLGIGFEINCGKGNPNMNWYIQHAKVLFALLPIHLRVFTSEFVEI